MDTKTLERNAKQQLELALSSMEAAQSFLSKASNSIDDFPTARHEMNDLAQEATLIMKKISDLQQQLKIKGIQ